MMRKRRGHLLIWGVGTTSAGLLAVTIALWTGPRWLAPRVAARAPGCLYTVPTRARAIALTIDDGPGLETPEILRVLRAHDTHATFFLISTRVSSQEAIVNDIVAAGHEIGNHMTRDEPSIRLTPAAFDAAAREAGTVLYHFAPVRWLRPGSGWYTQRMIRTVEQAGYRCALGSIYPFDAQLPSSAFASRYVLANARPGSVIVLHDGGARGRRTAETLRRILPVLHGRGYRVMSLSELERIAADAKANEPTRSSPAPSPSP